MILSTIARVEENNAVCSGISMGLSATLPLLFLVHINVALIVSDPPSPGCEWHINVISAARGEQPMLVPRG